MDPSASSPTNSSKNLLVVGLGILIVVLLIATGYLFMKVQSLTGEKDRIERKLNQLKDAKAKIDTELAVLKSTDLAKEVELLQLKLNTTEKDLSALRQDYSVKNERLNILEANAQKIKPFLAAIDAVQLVLLGDTGPTRSAVAAADPKVAALNDADVSRKWERAKEDIDFEKQSWQQRYFGITISLMVVKVLNFLP